MDKVSHVETIANRGKIPDQELINKKINNRQEKGEYVDDIQTTCFFDNNRGLQEYCTTIVFKEDSRQKDFAEDGWTVEELGE